MVMAALSGRGRLWLGTMPAVAVDGVDLREPDAERGFWPWALAGSLVFNVGIGLALTPASLWPRELTTLLGEEATAPQATSLPLPEPGETAADAKLPATTVVATSAVAPATLDQAPMPAAASPAAAAARHAPARLRPPRHAAEPATVPVEPVEEPPAPPPERQLAMAPSAPVPAARPVAPWRTPPRKATRHPSRAIVIGPFHLRLPTLRLRLPRGSTPSGPASAERDAAEARYAGGG